MPIDTLQRMLLGLPETVVFPAEVPSSPSCQPNGESMSGARVKILLFSGLSALALLVALTVSCASREAAPAMYPAEPSYDDAKGGAAPAPAAPGGPRMEEAAAMNVDRVTSARRPTAPNDTSTSEGGATATGEQKPESPPAPVKRLVHYNGYAKLRVTRPTEVLDQVVALAASLGGFTERLAANSVTIRVPVETFEDTFEKVLLLGDVLEKSISAQDVTDAVMEIGLRLQTAEATRERLILLLAKARTEQEKLELLAQIQRLTEEIDRMQNQVRTLESLAAFSRLTVETVQREAMSARSSDEEIAEFRWIQRLSPFRRDVAYDGKLLELQVPEGLVALDNKRTFLTESADGAVFWATRLKNRPEGSSDFWLEALKVRLEPEFESVTSETVGNFKLLRLKDKSESPYLYLLGVYAHGDDLDLVEVYYPSPAHETRYGAAVKASIQGGAK